MQAFLTALLRTMIRYLVKPVLGPPFPVWAQRLCLRLATLLMRPPRGSSFSRISVKGRPVERVRCGSADGGAILYLHGGAYVAGSPATHRSITGRLAKLTASEVFAPDYRLAPEHPFPAALEDAVATYRWLLAQGYSADKIAIVGDSAGGGLTMATALKLRDEGTPLPAALVTFSPWVDLGAELEPDPELARQDVMIRPDWGRHSADAYRGRTAADHPLVSPVHADLHGLPPTLIQVGTREVLLHDSERLAEGLKAAGSSARLEIYHDMWHVFQVHGGWLKRADDALSEAAEFICHARAQPAPVAADRQAGAGVTG